MSGLFCPLFLCASSSLSEESVPAGPPLVMFLPISTMSELGAASDAFWEFAPSF